MKSREVKKNIPVKKASLGRVLGKNKKIKGTVKEAASDRSSVDEAFMQEKAPVRIMKKARTHNEAAEHKGSEAAAGLKQVNAELTQEKAERKIVESELVYYAFTNITEVVISY